MKNLCKCGHPESDHSSCDCPMCPVGGHDCYAKIRKGNNNDFCECQQFHPKKNRKGIGE